tara:strand:- start:245 stop:439 length:195 start_codon:yes stop_codon:yes gene_type:complete
MEKGDVKPGMLVRWIDYVPSEGGVPHVGIFLRWEDHGWGDIVVLKGSKEIYWTSWQCEVISGGR